MKEHLDKVKAASTQTLSRLVIKALNDARQQIEAQAMRFSGAKLPPINEEAPNIVERFSRNLSNYFDALVTLTPAGSEIEPDNYDSLSLVDHDYLEAMIAMEGMVKQMRDRELKGVKSLVTRFETMFPNIRIDITNNPLDPEQIGDCFNEAIRPLGLKAHYLLTIYREFNKSVFGHYEELIEEANQVLIDIGVLPDLDITAEERAQRKQARAAARAQLEAELMARQEAEAQDARPGERSKTTRAPSQRYGEQQPELPGSASPQPRTQEPKAQESRAQDPEPLPVEPRRPPPVKSDSPPPAPVAAPANDSPAPPSQPPAEIFSMMQTLVQGLANSHGAERLPVSAAQGIETTDLATQQEALRAQQDKLTSLLNEVERQLLDKSEAVDAESIGRSIHARLKDKQDKGELQGLHRASGDIINLVTMLYQAIWKDPALLLAMKELIGRTQIAIMKVALEDTEFFENENHPGRVLLNELALTGLAWTESDDLENDELYQSIHTLVEDLLSRQDLDQDYLQEQVERVRELRADQAGTDLRLEQRIRQATDPGSNMEDVNAFVSQKIRERILKGYLDPAIRHALDAYLHAFLVKLILKEGPDGKSWKPVISTIDVLLWTVQADKQPGDRDRFNRINPRLLDNLTKAMQIGGVSKTKITKFMRQLKQIQEYTFHKAEIDGPRAALAEEGRLLSINTEREPARLSREDPFLRRVDKLPIGTWLEFRGVGGRPVRCSLAARIDSIDKLFFADQQGRKVAEMTRARLAAEMKSGDAKVLSDDSLLDRAMQAVIHDLKDGAPKQADSASA